MAVSATALRPAASPVDTYARPAAAYGGGGLAQIAEALGSFNPALSRLAVGMAQDRAQASEAEAQKRIGGMTFEERQKAVSEGLPEFEDPWFKAAFIKSYGQSLALHDRDRLIQEYETDFDKSQDVAALDAWVRERIQPSIAGVSGNKFAAAGYAQAMDQYTSALMSKHEQSRLEKFQEDKNQAVFDGFRSAFTEGKASGRTPEEIASNLWTRVQQNREMLRMPYDEQNRMLMQVLQGVAAEGDEASLKAVLEFDRPGAGRLGDVRSIQGNILELKNLAKRQRIEILSEQTLPERDGFRAAAQDGRLNVKGLTEFRRKYPGVITDDGFMALTSADRSAKEAVMNKALIEQARLDKLESYKQAQSIYEDALAMTGASGRLSLVGPTNVPLKDGGTRTASPEEVRSDAVNLFVTRISPAEAAMKKETPEQTFTRELAWFTENQVVNPKWSGPLNNGYIAATGPGLSDGNVPPALAAGLSLYERMRAEAPALLNAHLKDNSARDFYESVHVAKQYAGLDEKGAMSSAREFLRKQAAGEYDTPAYRVQFSEVEAKAKSITAPFWGSNANNLADVQAEVARVAKFYVKQGVAPTEAVKQAQDRVEAGWTNINGWMVDTTAVQVGDKGQFAASVGEYLKDWHATAGKDSGLDPEDLAIRPLDNGVGTYAIIHGASGIPVGAEFTIKDLHALRKRQLEAQQRELKDAITDNARNPRGPIPFELPKGADKM